MMKALKITAGAFEFSLPISFLPQYNQHEEAIIGINESPLVYLE